MSRDRRELCPELTHPLRHAGKRPRGDAFSFSVPTYGSPTASSTRYGSRVSSADARIRYSGWPQRPSDLFGVEEPTTIPLASRSLQSKPSLLKPAIPFGP